MSTQNSPVNEYDKVNREFKELEVRSSFFDVTVRDVPIWERLRYGVHGRILHQLNLFSRPPSVNSDRFGSLMAGTWETVKGMITRNPLRVSSADRLYWGHERRKRLDDGYWWDLYCDPIHEEEGPGFVHIESPLDTGHLTPAKTDDVRYVDFILKTGGLVSALPLISIDLSPFERRAIERIQIPLEETFNVDLDLKGMVKHRLSIRRGTKPLFRKMVDRIDPDVVVIVVSYGKETFIEVCKEMGIPVAELQHGGFGPDHPGYSYPGSRTKTTFPDYLLAFGEFWQDSVELPIPSENVIPVGYAHLERQKMQYKDIDSADTVVFLSQWSIGSELTRFAAEYAKRPESWEVVVKLHPGEYDNWRSLYPWLEEAPLTVIAGEEPPLYELLASASAQVGVYSTAIYEGLNFGLDTYILDMPGASRMRHLVEGGGARIVTNVAQLIDYLKLGDDTRPVDINYYFEPDAIQNFERAISEIGESTR